MNVKSPNHPITKSRDSRGVFLARVVRNDSICREHWRFVLELRGFPDAAPGQFVQLLCHDPESSGGAGGTFIRRPFSIGGLRRRGDTCDVDILHRAIGPGTRWLARLKPGDPVNVLGPLGQPFDIPADRSAVLLVGGGIGLPPLIWLAEPLKQAGKPTVAFCGARTADLLPLTRIAAVPIAAGEPALAFEEFARVGAPVVVSTDDGSLGVAGTVADAFERYLDRRPDEVRGAAVYTCGPERMMHAVAGICEAQGMPCQVCLERMMACGMGTCQSCVVRVRDADNADGWRYRLCCTDGPVFDGRSVIW